MVFFAVYLIDTITPLGEPVWLLYFHSSHPGLLVSQSYAIPAVCVATLLFLVCGFLFSPPGMAVNLAAADRFTFFIVFISVSLVLWIKRGL